MYREDLGETSEIFQALSSENRLKILLSLSEGEKCVHELTEQLEMTNSNISHHLRKLKDRRIVEKQKEGKHRYYSMNDEHIEEIIEAGVEHAREQ